MKIFTRWVFFTLMSLLTTQSFAQKKILSSANLGSVIEKITHNPATSYNDDIAKDSADAEAYVYLTAAYANKIKEVVYHVRDLPDANLNPFKIVAVTGKN